MRIVFLIALCCAMLIVGCYGFFQAKTLRKGDRAPDFVLHDYQGQEFSLKTALNNNNWVVLVFYPKDASLICTKQLCRIRDVMPQLPHHVKVIGVSSDSAQSHKTFSQQNSLSFPLAIDEDNHVRKLYGAHTLGGRVTVIINPQGYVHEICSDAISLKEHIAMIERLK